MSATALTSASQPILRARGTGLNVALRRTSANPAARRKASPSPPPERSGDYTRLEVIAAVSLGVLALLMSGIMPLFLGALADEHRLSAAGVGRLATVELLSAAIVTGLAGVLLPPRRLKLLAALASLALAATNIGSLGLTGPALTAMRAACGVPEGLLLWMVVGLVARTKAPDFISGLLFTGMAALQLVVAVGLALAVMPRFGADGGYVAVGLLSLLGVVAACGLPSRYGPPPSGLEGGSPPVRGWLALMAVFVFQAAVSGAGVYILPLAHQAGVSDTEGQIAISAALGLEVLGAVAATLLAEKVRFTTVFAVGGAALLGAFATYALHIPGWLFIAVSGLVGFFSLLVLPFFVSMTIQADPSRRAAVQIGAAQLLGGALGPVMASLFVSARDVRSSLIVSGAMLVVSLATIFWLSRPTRYAADAARRPVYNPNTRMMA